MKVYQVDLTDFDRFERERKEAFPHNVCTVADSRPPAPLEEIELVIIMPGSGRARVKARAVNTLGPNAFVAEFLSALTLNGVHLAGPRPAPARAATREQESDFPPTVRQAPGPAMAPAAKPAPHVDQPSREPARPVVPVPALKPKSASQPAPVAASPTAEASRSAAVASGPAARPVATPQASEAPEVTPQKVEPVPRPKPYVRIADQPGASLAGNDAPQRRSYTPLQPEPEAEQKKTIKVSDVIRQAMMALDGLGAPEAQVTGVSSEEPNRSTAVDVGAVAAATPAGEALHSPSVLPPAAALPPTAQASIIAQGSGAVPPEESEPDLPLPDLRFAAKSIATPFRGDSLFAPLPPGSPEVPKVNAWDGLFPWSGKSAVEDSGAFVSPVTGSFTSPFAAGNTSQSVLSGWDGRGSSASFVAGEVSGTFVSSNTDSGITGVGQNTNPAISIDITPEQIAAMSPGALESLAKGGDQEERKALMEHGSPGIHAFVFMNPSITFDEVKDYARRPSLAPEALRLIATTPRWRTDRGIVAALIKNPSTPAYLLGSLLKSLRPEDWRIIASSTKLPPAAVAAAKELLRQN